MVQFMDCFHCEILKNGQVFGMFSSRNGQNWDLIHCEIIRISLDEKGPKFKPFYD